MSKPFDPLQELTHTLQAAFIALEQANDHIQQDRMTLLSQIDHLQSSDSEGLATEIPSVAPITTPSHFHQTISTGDDLVKIQELEDQIINLQRQLTASEARIALAEHEKAHLSSDQETELTKAQIRAEQAQSRYHELHADINIRVDNAQQQANERIEDIRTQTFAELEQRKAEYQAELSNKEQAISEAQKAYHDIKLTLTQQHEQLEIWQKKSLSLQAELAAAHQQITQQQNLLKTVEKEQNSASVKQQEADLTINSLQKQLDSSQKLCSDQAEEMNQLRQEIHKIKEWREKAMRKMYKAGLIKRS